MSHPSNVVIPGPLAGLHERLAAEFLQIGYAPSTAARHLQLLAHVSIWMQSRGLGTNDLSWTEIGNFCRDQHIPCINRCAPPAVIVLMRLLLPAESPSKARVPGTELPRVMEDLLNVFSTYLRNERSLAVVTVELYGYQVRRFAQWFACRRGDDLPEMKIADVNQFFLDRSGDFSTSAARSSAIALRCLSRWLFLTARSSIDLSRAILTVKDHPQDLVPKMLAPREISALLTVKMSIRDKAILLLLIRLGLRATEVVDLVLEDFDWRAGTVLIRGKGGDSQLMPLPSDVGEAITSYLSTARRMQAPYREVFLSTYTPVAPLTRMAITAVVTYLADRAGIPGHVGAHRLRHSAATAVLAGGGTLEEAGQLLRHRSMNSTMLYAKTNLAALRELARPWPDTSKAGSECHD